MDPSYAQLRSGHNHQILSPRRCGLDDSHRDQSCTYLRFDDKHKVFTDPTNCFDDNHMVSSYVRIRPAHSHKVWSLTLCDFDDNHKLFNDPTYCADDSHMDLHVFEYDLHTITRFCHLRFAILMPITRYSMIQLIVSMTVTWIYFVFEYDLHWAPRPVRRPFDSTKQANL